MITLDSPDIKNITPEDLGELLIKAKKVYYTTAKPLMDDHTYDTLEEILRQKNPHHRLFSKAGHDNFDTGFIKKKHQMMMGSQNKVTTYHEMSHYFDLKKVNIDSFVVQPKCDGISLELIYDHGQLTEAITRGDGEIGDVITQNVVKMKNILLTLPKPISCSVRTEIVVTQNDFIKLNSLSSEKYSNPRNAASGLSQRLDSKYVEYCSLFAVDSNIPSNTEIEKINQLKDLGFTTVDTIVCKNYQQIEDVYQQFLKSKRQNYQFEIDGLVIKANSLQIQSQLGSQNNRPKGQVAYKFPSQTNQTTIKDIVWQVGPMGQITPVAQVEPIEISGAIVSYASLGNHKLVIEKNINRGDVIEISRRGDVIPHIEKVITKVNSGHTTIPNHCPICQTTLITSDRYLRCPNHQCLGQVLGSLRLFCDTLEIKGLSDKTIRKLYDSGKVKLPGDYYRLTVDDIKDLENLGVKSATNIINQIQAKKELTLVELLDSAAIPNLSKKRIVQLLRAGLDSLPKIIDATSSEIEKLPGFKNTLAQKIVDGINFRRHWIESIATSVKLAKSTTSGNQLSGLKFCITGELSQPRKLIEQQITDHGGELQTGVSKNTDYLVTNDQNSTSSKLVTARKLGIKIISEAELSSLM